MKSFIIIALLVGSVFLQPQITPGADNARMNTATPTFAVPSPDQPVIRMLDETELQERQGGDSGCYTYIDENGDTYAGCCLDLWLFRLCFAINWSGVERLMPF